MATLYITEQGATLTKTDGRIVVIKDRKVLEDIPAIKVEQVVVFGNVNFTTPAVRFFFDKNIDVAYLTMGGRYKGRLQPPLCKNALLRRKQYEMSLNREFCRERSREIVLGKVKNSLTFCKRNQRLLRYRREVKDIINNLKGNFRKISSAKDIEQIRGYEGICTRDYYRALKRFFNVDLGFNGRSFHPPRDPVNILLSLGYTLLYNMVFGAVNIVGLDPYQGYFHAIRQGHAALVSDLMEEWRTIIVDSMVVAMVNRREIGSADFTEDKEKIYLSKDGIKKFLKRFDSQMAREVYHNASKTKNPYKRCIELQVRHFAGVIMGKEKFYRPFLSR